MKKNKIIRLVKHDWFISSVEYFLLALSGYPEGVKKVTGVTRVTSGLKCPNAVKTVRLQEVTKVTIKENFVSPVQKKGNEGNKGNGWVKMS